MTNPMQTGPRHVTRREFLKITAIGAGLLAAGGLIRASSRRSPEVFRETRLLMGTVINLTVIAIDEDEGRNAIRITFAEIERLIALFDHRRPSSPVATLNRQGHILQTPLEVSDIIQRACYYSEISRGAFDITIKPVLEAYQAGKEKPEHLLGLVDYRRIRFSGNRISFDRPGMAITLDGIAKGRVIDGGTQVLRALGFENIIVEAGGDLMACGQHTDGVSWRVGVQHPRKSAEHPWLTTIQVQDQAIATSGDYMNSFTSDYRQHHIIDPRNGRSPTLHSSVTVLAQFATDADALATTLMVLGREEGAALVEELPGVEALFVQKDLTTYRTRGFPKGA
jgi:thiamine biosynthesis lipoprotein